MERKGKSNKVVVEDLIKNLNQFVSLVENEFIDIKKKKIIFLLFGKMDNTMIFLILLMNL